MIRHSRILLLMCLCMVLIGCRPACNADNVNSAVEEYRHQYTRFDDSFQASVSIARENPPMAEAAIVIHQEQRDTANRTPIPKCVESVKTAVLAYMDSAIDTFTLIGKGAPGAEIESALENVDHQRQIVEDELDAALNQ